MPTKKGRPAVATSVVTNGHVEGVGERRAAHPHYPRIPSSPAIDFVAKHPPLPIAANNAFKLPADTDTI